MNKYSNLSREELNRVIAEKKGWKRLDAGPGPVLWGESPQGVWGKAPDFCGDMNAAMTLVEECGNACMWHKNNTFWSCTFYEPSREYYAATTTPARAICEAYCLWADARGGM